MELALGNPPAAEADLVLLNGAVRTMDRGRPEARAVAIAGGRLVAVGDDADALRARGPRTVVEDLCGAAVLPGLIDSHVHLDAAGRALGDADLYGVRSIAEMLGLLSDHARRVGERAPVLGRGDCLHPAALAERRLPRAADLDRVARDRTVAVADVEKVVLNTRALERLGLARDEADPPGGAIGRDPLTGEMDGTFWRSAKALTPFAGQNASGSDVALAEAIARAGRALAAAGITGAVFPGAGPEEIEAIRALDGRGELAVRVTALPPAGLLDDPRALERVGPCGGETGLVRVGPLKVFHDRFVMHRTALMHEPYEGEPANRGSAWLARGDLRALVRRAEAAGFAVAVHATGDRGLDEAIDAISEAPPGAAPMPHHVVHAYLPTPRALARLAELGVAAAVQPAFLRAWGDALVGIVGERRAEAFLPLRTYLRNGVTIGAGSDGPIASFRPGPGLRAAATREAASGRVLGPEERISPAESLGLYTLGSAAVTGDAGRTGSIRAGKLADLVILERDPLSGGAEALAALDVLRTIVGGRTVYRKGEPRA